MSDKPFFHALALTTFVPTAAAESPAPVADKIACTVPDRQDIQWPGNVSLTGMIGTGPPQAHAVNRLLAAIPTALLEGFRIAPAGNPRTANTSASGSTPLRSPGPHRQSPNCGPNSTGR